MSKDFGPSRTFPAGCMAFKKWYIDSSCVSQFDVNSIS